MQLQHVYDTWVANGRCSSAKLGVELGLTEAAAARLLTQAIVAASSGVFGAPKVQPHMQVRKQDEGRVK